MKSLLLIIPAILFISSPASSGEVKEFINMHRLVECPPGGVEEEEECGQDVNGGCDMEPGEEYFEPIECGTTICGTAWADGGSRDTDWYTLSLSEEVLLTVSGQAEFPFQLAVISPGLPFPCQDYDVRAIAEVEADEIINLDAPVGPGEVWIRANDSGFDGNPCGEDDDDYYFTVHCRPCQDTVTIEIMTDDYPLETTWALYESESGLVWAQGSCWEPRMLYTWHICVDQDLCYEWIIFDSYGDGICCDFGEGYYNVYDPSGELLCTGGEFADRDSCYIGDCIGACCVLADCVGDLLPQECADEGGEWYAGQSCDTLICPLTCDDAIYSNGNQADGAFPSQCDPTYPFQAEVVDDFILDDDAEIGGIVCWMDFWGGDIDGPADLSGITLTIYDDAGGIPAGSPIDGDPNCAHEGDIVWSATLQPGEFGYLHEIGDVWRIYASFDGPVLMAGTTYWLGFQGILRSEPYGQCGWVSAEQQNGSFSLLYFPLLGYDNWTIVWDQDVAFCLLPPWMGPGCDYLPGDCNCNGVSEELSDIVSIISQYRGAVEVCYTCQCGERPDFPPQADVDGNCVALELSDVICLFHSRFCLSWCPDCPPVGRLDGGKTEKPGSVPTLKLKAKMREKDQREGIE
jgi:hypothetical protein